MIVQRRKQFKQWLIENQEAVIIGTVVVTVVVGFGFLVKAEIRANERMIGATNEWIDELNAVLEAERQLMSIDAVKENSRQ